MNRWPRISRDTILFTLGIWFATNEVIFRDGPERASVLAFIATLLGSPFLFQYAERRRKDE